MLSRFGALFLILAMAVGITPDVVASPNGHAPSARSSEAMARDVYRHPTETLKFFEVQPNMTVVEVWPGGGWYSDILGPLLKNQGTYYAAGFVT